MYKIFIYITTKATDYFSIQKVFNLDNLNEVYSIFHYELLNDGWSIVLAVRYANYFKIDNQFIKGVTGGGSCFIITLFTCLYLLYYNNYLLNK